MRREYFSLRSRLFVWNALPKKRSAALIRHISFLLGDGRAFIGHQYTEPSAECWAPRGASMAPASVRPVKGGMQAPNTWLGCDCCVLKPVLTVLGVQKAMQWVGVGEIQAASWRRWHFHWSQEFGLRRGKLLLLLN